MEVCTVDRVSSTVGKMGTAAEIPVCDEHCRMYITTIKFNFMCPKSYSYTDGFQAVQQIEQTLSKVSSTWQ